MGIVSAGLMIVSRLITNHHCKMRRRDMLAAGTTNGFIPPWVSAVYVLGMLGLVVAFIWSFFNVGWCGPLFVPLSSHRLCPFTRPRHKSGNSI